MCNKINNFLTELRESAEAQYNIFTQGSCFRLYLILKTIFPKAEPYWSDMDNHCIIKIDDKFYDIGGEINKNYVDSQNYNRIRKEHIKGFSLLKYSKNESNMRTITIEKYK